MEVFVPFKKVVVFLVVVVVVVVVAKKHTRLSRYFVIPQENGSQSSGFVTLHTIFYIQRISIYPSKGVRPCRKS